MSEFLYNLSKVDSALKNIGEEELMLDTEIFTSSDPERVKKLRSMKKVIHIQELCLRSQKTRLERRIECLRIGCSMET